MPAVAYALIAVAALIWVLAERRRNERLARTAEIDPLTGLGNRRALARLSDTPAAWLLCDLDGFKQVNDRYGHHAGDVVLREFAAKLVGQCRAGDSVFRLGGDEFAVALHRTADADALTERVSRMRVVYQHATVTASVGLAGELAAADAAMYAAKRSSRGPAGMPQVARRAASG